MSESLIDFLIERISEDEAIGRDWVRNRGKVEVHGGGTGYLALVNSDRVLAECAAKRRIVELHGGYHECEDGNGHGPDDGEEFADPCLTLRALASVYADHPDFDPTWSLT